MKKLLITAALLLSSYGYTSTTGTLLLRGNVPEILSIEVIPLPIAIELNLFTETTDLKVATVKEMSNHPSGYKVAISSANNGKLTRVGGTETVAYTLKYNGNIVNLNSTQEVTYTSTPAVTQNRDVKISYSEQDEETTLSGNYEDTLTFTISTN